MLIIFVAHVPGNPWFLFIPARFGFSSAAELFVFASGVASGFAFGGVFIRAGFLAGTLRVVHRLWQVYWAHVGLFLTMTAASAAGLALTGIDYPVLLGLQTFLADPASGVLDFMRLRFIPNFNDILPLYMVLLAMIPLVMGLAAVSPRLALGSSLLLWLVAHVGHLNFPAGNIEQTAWYFSPFAWQMLFFTGFAFARGWLPAVTLARGRLFWLCTACLIISVPLNFWAVLDAFPAIDAFRNLILPEGNQMYLSPLRLLHFLALAYVALVLVEPVRDQLWRARAIITVGQQSLPSFLASTSLTWVAGMVLDQTGRGLAAASLVNLAGFGAIILTARVAAFFKAPPWQGGPDWRARGAEAPQALPRLQM